MRLRRRQFQQLAASALALPAISTIASAQTYPAQPVRMMVGFAAGQAIDILARLIGQSLTDQFSQQFVVENKPGAGANNPINTTLYDKLGFDLLRDFAPVAGIYRVYQVMVVNPAFPAKTVPEFIAYARANPGKINFGSAGTGSVANVTGEWFRMVADISMQHVPYRGAPLALADLMSGQVQVMFDNLPSSIEHIRAGRLRALAVSTPAPLDLLPGVPTISQFLPGFETSAFAGLGAPAGTPTAIVDKLNAGVNAALADPKLKARILDLGGVPMPMSPAEFGRFLAEETEKWAKVIRAANIKPG